jgi:hypothetical protein
LSFEKNTRLNANNKINTMNKQFLNDGIPFLSKNHLGFNAGYTNYTGSNAK